LYNEYIDDHKLPADVQNTPGAEAWVAWLKGQIFK
jgi:hypothetical protein